MSDMNDAITQSIREVFHYVAPGSEIKLFTDLRRASEDKDIQNLVCWDLKFATTKTAYGSKTVSEVYKLVVEGALTILSNKFGSTDEVVIIGPNKD